MDTIKYLEVGKELMKSKTMAKFSHYCFGKLYYKVDLENGTYQFPISTIEEGRTFSNNDPHDGSPLDDIKTIVLSSDLGTTPFNFEMRGSELNRWIKKAIEKDEFIKVG